MKKLFWGFFLLLLIPARVFATGVVINEILPNPVGDDKENEWVEFYNPSDLPVSLNVYILEDRNGNRITLNGTINKWLVYYPKGENRFALANDGDTIINLYQVSNTLELIDTFAYSSSTEGKSWGRIPDGGPVNEQKLDPSPEGSNSLPTPTPAPPPSQTPEPTSTTTPPTPVPIPSPTPTTAAIATNIPTVKPKVKPTPTAEPLVLGEETSEPTVPETIHETAENQTPPTFIERLRSLIPSILIVVGAALTVGFGVPLVIQEIRSRKKPV